MVAVAILGAVGIEISNVSMIALRFISTYPETETLLETCLFSVLIHNLIEMQRTAASVYAPQYPRKKSKKARIAKRTYLKRPRTQLGVYVRREIDKLMETKQVAYTWSQIGSAGLANYSTGAGVWGVYNITPFFPNTSYLSIAQGTGQGSRVGNTIRTHSLIYSGVIYPNQYNATYNPTPIPQEVMFLLLSRKDTGDTLLTTLSALYQVGSSTANPDGTVLDIVRDFNYDLYNIHYKRVFKIGAAENVGTGAVPGFQNYASNDFAYNRKFKMNLTKYIDRIVKFNDGTNTQVGAKNFIFGVWMTCDADGTGSTHQPTCVTSQLVYKFKDA